MRRILHIDLARGLPALEQVEAPVEGYHVVFWYGSIPLADCFLWRDMLPLSPGALRAYVVKAIAPAVGYYHLKEGFEAPMPVVGRYYDPAFPDFQKLIQNRQPLEGLRAYFTESKGPGLSVSVIVCTRNRPDDLSACLDALLKLTFQPLEIIVVDNAPQTDVTRTVVQARPGIRYVSEPVPGLSRARNTGIRASRGEVIAFTDDDVIVHPHWTQRIVEAFSDPEVSAVTGLILPAELETQAQVQFQSNLEGEGWGYRPKLFGTRFFEQMKRKGTPVWKIGAGANMAFRRRAIDQYGLFDERLGAGASGCSEDSEYWYRILSEGGTCRYEPLAVVYHRHRYGMDELKEQMYQYMRGHVTALFVQFVKYRHGGNLYRLFFALPRYYGRLIRKSLFRKSIADPTLRRQIQGYFAGYRYFFKHRSAP